MNGEYVGRWDCHAGRPQEFTYAASWADAEDTRPISLSLPITSDATYKGEAVERYFENLLPDNREIRTRIQKHVGAASERAFDLLEKIGRDCIGAIQLTVEEDTPPDVRTIDGTAITTAGIEQLLIKTSAPATFGAPDSDEDFRISLAGAQEKTALLLMRRKWMRPHNATPSTHILKLPIGKANQGIDLHTSVENEWLCTQILREYGLRTSTCSIQEFGAQKVLVVERFDRRLAKDGRWWLRLPQEDFCQATGTSRDQKYEAAGGPGIETILRILLGSENAEADRQRFFKTQILFWMLCAIDGHAKNFSLFLNGGGQFALTPLYDVLSAYPVLGAKAGMLPPRKVRLAMAIQGDGSRHYLWHSIARRHFEGMAKRCGVDAGIGALLDELAEVTPAVIKAVEKLMPATFPDAVATTIFAGLKKTASQLVI